MGKHSQNIKGEKNRTFAILAYARRNVHENPSQDFRGGGGGAPRDFPSPAKVPPPPPPQNFESVCTVLYGFVVLGDFSWSCDGSLYSVEWTTGMPCNLKFSHKNPTISTLKQDDGRKPLSPRAVSNHWTGLLDY